MSFRKFFLAMKVPERCAYAEACGTQYSLLKSLAYDMKQVDLGLADVLVAVSRGQISLDDVPLSEKAKRHRALREMHGKRRRVRPAPGAQQSEAVL